MSFSKTMSTGKGRNMGATWKPLRSVRVPGSKALKTPSSGPALKALVGTKILSSSLMANLLELRLE